MKLSLREKMAPFIGLLILIWIASCSNQPQKSANLTTDTSTEEYPFDWPPPPSELSPGYQVFPLTYDLWANSFQYWIDSVGQYLPGGDGDFPLDMVFSYKALDSIFTSSETNYLKMYFAIPEEGTYEIPVTLIMVGATPVVGDNGNVTYLNDTGDYYLPQKATNQNEDSTFWHLPILSDETIARQMVQSWSEFINDTVQQNSGIGAIYSYTFPKGQIDSLKAKNVDAKRISLRFGLQTVSPADSNYWFNEMTGSTEYPMRGFVVPSLILQGRSDGQGQALYMDYSRPCPRWCGNDDLWMETGQE